MFIGRDSEMQQLGAAVAAAEPRIALIYGRRRIGKSALIRRALDRRPAIFFEGLENQPLRRQMQDFMRQMSEQLGRKPREVSNWTEALLELNRLIGKRPMTIVLDEFQWLANYRQELVAVLKMVWENYLSRAPGRTLILCGSIASFMTTKVLQSSALYGRVDLTIHLQPFSLAETSAMLKGRGLTEILDAQSLTGGVPKYVELLKDGPSVLQAMEKLAFQRGGYFLDEYERIFVSHFGKNDHHERIVRELVKAPYGLTRRDLAAAAEVPEGGQLSLRLYDLEAAGFISSHRPLDKPANSRLIRYYISDPWLGFYHQFVRPNLRKIEQGQKRLFDQVRQGAAFRSWMGRAFELVCLRHQTQLAEALGFAGVSYTCGPWFRAPRRALEGVQIDLMFQRADNVITLCEMKRQTAPIGKSIIAEVERKAGIIEAEYPRKTVQRVLVTGGPVSREVNASGYFFAILDSKSLF